MVSGIINSFSWIFNGISSEKSSAFQLTCIEDSAVFPPAEYRLVNSNFRRTSRNARCKFLRGLSFKGNIHSYNKLALKWLK